jgi:beta-galactosidase
MSSSKKIYTFFFILIILIKLHPNAVFGQSNNKHTVREKISINSNWKFYKYEGAPDNLLYDVRPEVLDANDSKVADSKPTDAVKIDSKDGVLKSWILPTANPFIKDENKKHKRPEGNPGSDFDFVKASFDDKNWESVSIPHDWAIKGPFYTGDKPIVGGGMGRLPSQGVAWYRRKLEISSDDKGKNIYLDIDGAMSYAIVWLNGNLVGGWPYGYNSFRLDLTPYLNFEGDNQLAIRLDNPNHSARWYPGGGIYRNVWLTKTNPIQIAHWGTTIITSKVSKASALVELNIKIQNNLSKDQTVTVKTDIYELDNKGKISIKPIGNFLPRKINLKANDISQTVGVSYLQNPKFWGPYPTQKPNLYIAKTKLYSGKQLIDEYETKFGIREITFDSNKGIIVNGEHVKIKGVNQHHDLGALGAAFNAKAAKRQLEMLQELGCNAIRMSHNPPAPELLDLCDEMGFLVIDEIFDSWEKKKTPHDFHLIFPDWHEADLRSFIRRDKNHPSIMSWSFGNEVGEQYTDQEGALLAKKHRNIVREEDPTRPASASQNYAKPDMPFTAEMDFLNLNYQGEGIRNGEAYAHLTTGIRTKPLYEAFHSKFPDKVVLSTESASALSTRGSYVFPVTKFNSAPVGDLSGGNPQTKEVSGYELYTAQFGSSPDKVFETQDKNNFVAGEMVWTGWDYLGEPTPYYSAKGSYSGIIDLAGFKKDRFYLYQSRWRPELPMTHILPHWNWPDRIGQITPVHVFTSGNEVELFLNGKSLGRKQKSEFEYRLRWDDVVYEPGTLKAVSYKNNKFWSEESIQTSGVPAKIVATLDQNYLKANTEDLAFITVKILDKNNIIVPDANISLKFSVSKPGILVATDNGNPADLDSFDSQHRKSFNGLALAIVKAENSSKGNIKIEIEAPDLEKAVLTIELK